MAARTKKAAGKERAQAAASSSAVAKIQSSAAALRSQLRTAIGDDSIPDPLAQGKVVAFPSGLLSLDLATGVGGWPRARVNYIAGPKGGGKTTLALRAIAAEQRRLPDAQHALVDVENAYTESLAQLCEVDTDPEKFIVVRPDTAEDAFKACMILLGFDEKGRVWTQNPKRAPVATLVYDSWAGSPTEEVGMATLARVGAMWWPKMASVIRKSNALFFVINQIRLKPGVLFGNPEYEPGGEALQHAISGVRMTVHKTEVVKGPDKQDIAHTMSVKIGKSKVSAPQAPFRMKFSYYTGFDELSDAKSVLDLRHVSLKEAENGTGNYLAFKDPKTGETLARGNGENAFLDEMRTDPDVAERFIAYAREMALGLAA